MLSKRCLFVVCVLFAASLACGTNTPVARLSAPQPTRTPLPTFTLTPIPPTPAPTPTPGPTPIVEATVSLPTDTPVADVPPTPTDTPVPPTPTPPPPTNAPPPPPPPTNTPPPTPVPEPVVSSPLATPTPLPEPDTPPGRYELEKQDWEPNCYDVGVTGRVRDKGDDKPIQWVAIEVTGDDDDVNGPFMSKTGADGKYSIYIGPLDDVGGVELEARVVGPSVSSEDKPKWIVSDDCHDGDANQIMELDWQFKR